MNDILDADLRDMLRGVRAVDPGADAEAVRRYAREITEADAAMQTLEVDPTSDPFDAPFSPDWNSEHPR